MDAENPGDLGGLNILTDTGKSPNSSSDTLSAAERILSEGRTKRKYTKRTPGSSGAGTQPSIPQIPPELFAKLYKPELWAKVLCAPADACALATGSKIWEVSQNEKEMLGETGSVAAQCFAVADPRYLALSLCVIALIDVYATRIALYKAEVREKKRREGMK